MFSFLRDFDLILVTGPHRSGTTICAEMIGHDLGKKVIREEAFDYRNIIKAEKFKEGVIQGPYLLPWAPIFDGAVVYVKRPGDEIDASVERLKDRGVSTPFFHWQQALRLWNSMVLRHPFVVEYHSLKDHPLWVENRKAWGHRQTS